MLKVDIHREDDEKMLCNIECAGSISDIISETAALVENIKKSLKGNGKEAEMAFDIAISAAIMGISTDDLADELKGRAEKRRRDSDD